MKILHIGKFYPPFYGGMESYLCDLAEAQVRQGHQVTVLVHNHEWSWFKSQTKVFESNGVRVIRQAALRPFLFAPMMLRLGQQLKIQIKTFKPDLIHLHSPNPSLFYLLLNKPLKAIPWVMSWHSDMVTEHSGWLISLVYRLVKPLESKLIQHTDLILVSSENYVEHSRQLKANQKITKVIPLGIDENKINALSLTAAEHRWRAGKFRMFHLGRLTFYKNQSMMIDAMSKLPEAELLIAGSGQLKNRLSQQICALKKGHVSLLGSQAWQEVHELFAACQLFCMASNDRAESFGVVLLEAIFHNKIILVPDTVGSGMKWLAENYNKGYVYEADNQADYIAKVRQIETNYDNIMQQPQDFNYSINQIAALIQTHYLTIL